MRLQGREVKMSFSKSFRAVISAMSILFVAFFVDGCANKTPSMEKTLIHEGYSTAAMVYYMADTNESQESHIKILCSMVWVEEKKLLTSLHCAKTMQKLAQIEEDTRYEAKVAAAENCDDFKEAFGICKKEAGAHHTVGMEGLKVHFYEWEEDVNIGAEPTAWHLGEVEKWDAEHDLVLIKALGNAVPTHHIAKLAMATPAIGEKVTVVGHPAGMGWTFLAGTIASERGDVPGSELMGPFLQIQVPAFGGNSGGGAFNEAGELVGIADFTVRAPGETFFTHTATIRSFLSPVKVSK